MPEHPACVVRLNASRDHLRNRAARQLRAAVERDGRVPIEAALRIVADAIEDALGEGFAGGALAAYADTTEDDDD